jgi:hypothetical protein
VIKYPHSGSNIPRNQGAAVFKGQLIRYAVICNNLWDFQTAALRLAGRLLSRGHKAQVLIATWMKYLDERWPQLMTHKYRMQEWFPVALSKLIGKEHHGPYNETAPQGLKIQTMRPGKRWTIKLDGTAANEPKKMETIRW